MAKHYKKQAQKRKRQSILFIGKFYKKYTTPTKQKSHNKKERLREYGIVFTNAITKALPIILTGLIAWFTFQQTRIAKNTASSAEQSAKAAEQSASLVEKSLSIGQQSLNIQQKSMEVANRAYLVVDKMNGNNNLNHPNINVTIKNTGQTPAYQIRSLANFYLGKVLPDTMITPLEKHPKFIKKPTILGKDETISFELFLKKQPTLNQIEMFSNGKLLLICIGNVRYIDVFGYLHFLNFCAYMKSSSDDIFYCPKHNNAN